MLHEFTQEVENTARAVVDEVHTAIPGTITSFNVGSGTVTVKPTGKYVTSDGRSLPYPALSEVPLVFPFCQQAGVGIAYPVHGGDSCIVIVSEVELDEWRSGAESEGSLRFDLSNAVAIPGLLWGGGELISKAAEKDAVVIGAGDIDIVVSELGIEVTDLDTKILVDEFGIKASVKELGISVLEKEINAKLNENSLLMNEEKAELLIKDIKITASETGIEATVKDSKFVATENDVTVTVGDNEMVISETDIAIRGDLKVDGNISYTGTLTEG